MRADIVQVGAPTTTDALVWSGAAVVVVLALMALHHVPRGQRLVVVRGDVVQRVVESGIAWRIPWVERVERMLSEAHDMPLGIRATTSDGVSVLVLAEATVELEAPRPGTPYFDPWVRAELAAEDVVAAAVSSWPVGELPDAAAAAVRPLLRSVQAATRAKGVDVLDLELVEVGVSLAAREDTPVRGGRDSGPG